MLKMFCKFTPFVLFVTLLFAWNLQGAPDNKNKKLDRLLYGGPKNFRKDKWPKCFFQRKYPTELIYYKKNGEVKFFGKDVSEVILTFTESGDFQRADILLDYAGQDGYPQRLPNLKNRISNSLTRFLKNEPECIQKDFIGDRTIHYECWKGPHSRIYLYYHWKNGKGRANISFVAMRIEPLKIPKQDPLAWYQPKKTTLDFSINTATHKLLKAPMRLQLHGLGACWFTTYTRIAISAGSEIPSIVLAVVMGGRLGERYYDAWRQLGMMRNEVKFNSHKAVAQNGVRFIYDYNATAKRMKKKTIPVKKNRNGRIEFQRLLKPLDNSVVQNVNKDYFGDKYQRFCEIIKTHIDKGVPVRWSADLFQGGGSHALLIVGYDTKNDIIYFSNHWDINKELEKTSFAGAFAITTDLQTLLLL